MRPLLTVVFLAGCSVVDDPYPLVWEPLKVPPSADCRHYEGVYADRGESANQVARPSLTRELFGPDTPWEQAESVRLELTPEGAVATVMGKAGPTTLRLEGKEGEVKCDRGVLVLKNRRWVTSGIMMGRESVNVDVHEADPYLVARVHEVTTGLVFMAVPLSGEGVRWFRFRRLGP